jgi:hypothetical protein
MSNCYDKIEEYISAIFNVFRMVKKKAETNKDNRLIMISLVIYNYSKYMAKEYGVNLLDVKEGESINLIPVFEYISKNNIELLDFSNIDINDIDITKKEDLERFVLSHVYYITQSKPQFENKAPF